MRKLQKELDALGVDVNATGNQGRTALMFASQNNNVESIEATSRCFTLYLLKTIKNLP